MPFENLRALSMAEGRNPERRTTARPVVATRNPASSSTSGFVFDYAVAGPESGKGSKASRRDPSTALGVTRLRPDESGLRRGKQVAVAARPARGG